MDACGVLQIILGMNGWMYMVAKGVKAAALVGGLAASEGWDACWYDQAPLCYWISQEAKQSRAIATKYAGHDDGRIDHLGLPCALSLGNSRPAMVYVSGMTGLLSACVKTWR